MKNLMQRSPLPPLTPSQLSNLSMASPSKSPTMAPTPVIPKLQLN